MTGNQLNCEKWLTIVTLMFLMLSSFAMADPREPKGEVVLATGEVWITSITTGEKTPLRKGHQINIGDRFESAEGAATLKMVDNAILSLHPFSELIVRDYDVDTGKIRIELNQGRLDTQTGEASRLNRQGYRLNTPFAALGIRGTEYSIRVIRSQLDVYVHAGEIVLSPFSQDNGCVRDQFGPCDTPLAATLKENSGTWLQLIEGSSIKRIDGTPDFILPNQQSSSHLSETEDTKLHSLNGESINPYISSIESIPDPILNAMSSGKLPSPNDINSSKDSLIVIPKTRVNFYTDGNFEPLSLDEYRDLLRTISLGSFAYNTNNETTIFNFEINLLNNRTTNIWLDTTNEQLWGYDTAIQSILESRFWPEGRNLWRVLPTNLVSMNSDNVEWFKQVRLNDANLWRLPLSTQAIFFSPIDTDYVNNLELQTFVNVWTQTPSQTRPTRQDNLQNNQIHQGIKDITIDPSNRNFLLRVTTGGTIAHLYGTTDTSGVLFASNNDFKVRGHSSNNSIIIILQDLNTGLTSINGLSLSNDLANLPGAKWTERNTNSVTWGHWSNFAELSDDQIQLINNYFGQSVSNNHFALSTPHMNSLPAQGKFDFGLTDYEAIYVNNDSLLPAEITNASLTVNFSEQRINTQFDLTAPGLEHMHRFEAQGQFDQRGIIDINNTQTQANAQGFIGNQGHNASFIFELPIDQGSYYSGMTHWQR